MTANQQPIVGHDVRSAGAEETGAPVSDPARRAFYRAETQWERERSEGGSATETGAKADFNVHKSLKTTQKDTK